MPLLNTYVPGLKYGAKILPSEIIGANGFSPWTNFFYVDADNGSDSNVGNSPSTAFATVAAGVAASAAGGTVAIKARKTVALATDPTSYTENVVIPNGTSELTLFGYGTGRVQNGLPQLKVGTTTTQAIITVRAPGCGIFNLGINGISATGGGILLDDDSSTKIANGTTIQNSHFKNCVGTSATDCRTGGAINWSANGGAWQVLISDNQFYKNVGDVVLKGTAQTAPQDVLIENNRFQGLATTTDCHLYLAGGSGMASITVNGNIFSDVLPSLSSGSIVRYVDMTGCTGMFSNNCVGGAYTTTGFGAAKVAAKIPTTVGISCNYSDSGLIVREA